jgi:hypothetical protein
MTIIFTMRNHGASLALTMAAASILMLLIAWRPYRPYREHYRAAQSFHSR